MKYGSVCSGIEAASVAWEPLGWEPVFFSEIEPFPSSVLAHHWPKVPNHGDMTRYAEWGYKPGAVDVLVAGTPCQSFSVAGLRGGLDDARGNLALVFARMVEYLRPRWVVWENVPGVLSSNGGRDFASIIGAFSELGYSCAWRILDAQYYGVPQRRRRVFLVASAGDWRGPAAVLFERESLRGNPQASRKTRKETASSTRDGLETGGWPKLVVPTLNAAFGKKLGLEDQHALGGGCSYLPKRSLCLNAGGMGRQDYETETLIATGGFFSFAENSRGELRLEGGDGLRTGSVTHGGGKPGQGYPAIVSNVGVRRLTPTECERLQGFPDGHTLVEHRGKIAADGPRYKAIGNSMAVPVMRWIGQRISKIDGMIRR